MWLPSPSSVLILLPLLTSLRYLRCSSAHAPNFFSNFASFMSQHESYQGEEGRGYKRPRSPQSISLRPVRSRYLVAFYFRSIFAFRHSIDFVTQISIPSRYGSYQADRSQVHRRKGPSQAARHQGTVIYPHPQPIDNPPSMTHRVSDVVVERHVTVARTGTPPPPSRPPFASLSRSAIVQRETRDERRPRRARTARQRVLALCQHRIDRCFELDSKLFG